MHSKYLFAAFAAFLLITSCTQGIHELKPSGKPTGYLIPTFQWANPEDAGTDIHDLVVAVEGADNAFSKHFDQMQELISSPLEMPVGQCSVLFLANASEADGYKLNGLPATKASGVISLAPAGHPEKQVYGSRVGVVVEDGELVRTSASLSAVLPTLTLLLQHIPAGVDVNVLFDNMAKDVLLSTQAENWVAPGQEGSGPYSLGTLTSENNTLSLLVLPTQAGQTNSTFTLDFMLGASRHIQCKMFAPPIAAGKKYTVGLDFNTISLEMHLDSYTISDWEEGWTYSGYVY